MTKMYNKADCEYKGGYIVCNDEVVNVDTSIIFMLNKLDGELQRKLFDEEHGKVEPVEIPEFVRKSEHEAELPKFEAKTPELDGVVEKGMRIMDEIDALDSAEKINRYFENIASVFEFAANDFVVSENEECWARFDLPLLGNPLELDKDKLVGYVFELFA